MADFELTAGELQAKIDEAVKKATGDLSQSISRLEATNRTLKEEKSDQKNRLDELLQSLEGIGGTEGIQAYQELRERLNQDEFTRLVAEGKTEEAVNLRLAESNANHKREIEARDKLIEQAQSQSKLDRQALMGRNLEIEVRDACLASEGFHKDAIADAVMLATTVFNGYDDETKKSTVLEGENSVVKLGADGTTPFGVAEWLEGIKETPRRSIWWEGNQSGNANGSGNPTHTSGVPDFSKMDQSEFNDWSAKNLDGKT